MLLLTFLATTFTPSVKFGEIKDSFPINEGFGNTLSLYIKEIYRFGLGAGAFLAVVMVMWGGFLYITSSGIASQAEKGKQAIQMAFLGVVILLSSYVLLLTINPALLELKFPNIPIVDPRGEFPTEEQTPVVPEPGLPAGITSRSMTPFNGACVSSASTQNFCFDAVSKEACSSSSGALGTGSTKNWFPNKQCADTDIQKTYRPVKPAGPLGRCIYNVAANAGEQVRGDTRQYIFDCYNVPQAFCSTTTTSTVLRPWEQGKTCEEFTGACWQPTQFQTWSCNLTSGSSCGTIKNSVWCGIWTNCGIEPKQTLALPKCLRATTQTVVP